MEGGGNDPSEIDERILRIYAPMSESAFYILHALRTPNHGYNIGREVLELTAGEVDLSPGTMYGSLSKMEQDGLVQFDSEVDRRKLYRITPLGEHILGRELTRIERLYLNSRGDRAVPEATTKEARIRE